MAGEGNLAQLLYICRTLFEILAKDELDVVSFLYIAKEKPEEVRISPFTRRNSSSRLLTCHIQVKYAQKPIG